MDDARARRVASRASAAAARVVGLEHGGRVGPARAASRRRGSCRGAPRGPSAASASASATSIGVWRLPPAPWPSTTTVSPRPWSEALVAGAGEHQLLPSRREHTARAAGRPRPRVVHSAAAHHARSPTVYEPWYGFREKPFNLTPDPKYLYLSPRHAEAFAHLEFGRRERGGFIADHRRGGHRQDDARPLLPLEARPGHRTARSSSTPRSPPTELLRTILDDLHVTPEGDSQEEPRGRAAPLPARGARGEPQRRAPDRRGAGPLAGGARAGPPDLEPRDRHREADPDRPDGPVGAARPARPPRAAAARAARDRALPPRRRSSLAETGGVRAPPPRGGRAARARSASRTTRSRAVHALLGRRARGS